MSKPDFRISEFLSFNGDAYCPYCGNKAKIRRDKFYEELEYYCDCEAIKTAEKILNRIREIKSEVSEYKEKTYGKEIEKLENEFPKPRFEIKKQMLEINKED